MKDILTKYASTIIAVISGVIALFWFFAKLESNLDDLKQDEAQTATKLNSFMEYQRELDTKQYTTFYDFQMMTTQEIINIYAQR